MTKEVKEMCHDAGKRFSFSSKSAAKRFLGARRQWLRVYYCPTCGVWRLTSRRRRRVA
jgi:hypothetical protein